MRRSVFHRPGRLGRSLLAAVAILGSLTGIYFDKWMHPSQARAGQQDEKASREAFLAAYKVLMHPRCMNCHPSGDVPLQGDDSHPHAQNVQRGKDGKGKYALKCANCHQETNLPGAHMPPGNPNWHLPPPETKMVFQGKSPAELARQLKDPKLNGGKTLEQILQHVSEDKLVLAGWDPGEGRTKPPLSHAEFAAKMREWIEKGAAIPE
jgi:mono/diheme cytochrome c family protein